MAPLFVRLVVLAGRPSVEDEVATAALMIPAADLLAEIQVQWGVVVSEECLSRRKDAQKGERCRHRRGTV